VLLTTGPVVTAGSQITAAAAVRAATAALRDRGDTMDKYATHMPIIDGIFSEFVESQHWDVLEFGMGMYSTPFFAKYAANVTAVEQQDEEWYRKMLAELVGVEGVKLCYMHGPHAGLSLVQRVDFAFVDGHVHGRAPAVNALLLEDVPIIVLHDSELVDYYGLKSINVPYGYNVYNYKHTMVGKNTTVFTTYDLSDSVFEEHEPTLFGV
jgi:prepilin-type processing-associated H-X9-DG protein